LQDGFKSGKGEGDFRVKNNMVELIYNNQHVDQILNKISMRRKMIMKKIVAVFIISLFLEGIVWAIPADRTLIKEYSAMVEKAALYLQEKGKDKAFAAFNDPKGEFVKTVVGENKEVFYIYVFNSKGEILSNGANSLLIGQKFIDIRDADGKLFYQEMIKNAMSGGSGWVSYKLLDPRTKKTQQKDCYFKRSGDYIIACSTK
jgi:cytochrome c